MDDGLRAAGHSGGLRRRQLHLDSAPCASHHRMSSSSIFRGCLRTAARSPTFFRGQKATRHVPIVFVDGAPEKVESVRACAGCGVHVSRALAAGTARGAGEAARRHSGGADADDGPLQGTDRGAEARHPRGDDGSVDRSTAQTPRYGDLPAGRLDETPPARARSRCGSYTTPQPVARRCPPCAHSPQAPGYGLCGAKDRT